jgi:GrpB-like predicted nucleotidyltransferase (UPF0157 family)
MEYEYEHIEVEPPDEQWADEFARMLAEIIYREMIKGKPYGDEEQ